MEENQAYQKDIESIRKLMERSVKFISLSGLSGILSGTFALIGAGIAYYLLSYPGSPDLYDSGRIGDADLTWKLIAVAVTVLVLSLTCGVWLTARKAKKAGVRFWDSTSRNLLINLAIPLVTGGLLILIFISHGYIEIIASACLIFYGLALLNASPNLYEEVRYLGYMEIITGLICAWLPGYGLVCWAVGFGVLHIIYGALMYRKYEA